MEKSTYSGEIYCWRHLLALIAMILLLCYLTYPKIEWNLSSPLTPAGSKIVRVMAADKILADFGHRFWSALRAAPEPKSKIIARILSLRTGLH